MSMGKLVSTGFVVLLCAVAVLSFAGATDERGREEQLSAKPETLEIGFEDKLTSKTVKLSKGGSLDVKLDSNPTTGYKWQLSGIDGGSVKETGSSYNAPPSNGMVGGGGAQVYKFAAESEGTSKIILNYKRSWEEESVSQAQITVDVV